jgi:hypothetical protein
LIKKWDQIRQTSHGPITIDIAQEYNRYAAKHGAGRSIKCERYPNSSIQAIYGITGGRRKINTAQSNAKPPSTTKQTVGLIDVLETWRCRIDTLIFKATCSSQVTYSGRSEAWQSLTARQEITVPCATGVRAPKIGEIIGEIGCASQPEQTTDTRCLDRLCHAVRTVRILPEPCAAE